MKLKYVDAFSKRMCFICMYYMHLYAYIIRLATSFKHRLCWGGYHHFHIFLGQNMLTQQSIIIASCLEKKYKSSNSYTHLMVELNPQTHLKKKQKHPTISPCCVICYNRFLIQNVRKKRANSPKLEFCQCNTNDIQLYFNVKCHSSPCFPTMPLISENQPGALVSGEDFPQTNPLNLAFVASRILIGESSPFRTIYIICFLNLKFPTCFQYVSNIFPTDPDGLALPCSQACRSSEVRWVESVPRLMWTAWK